MKNSFTIKVEDWRSVLDPWPVVLPVQVTVEPVNPDFVCKYKNKVTYSNNWLGVTKTYYTNSDTQEAIVKEVQRRWI